MVVKFENDDTTTKKSLWKKFLEWRSDRKYNFKDRKRSNMVKVFLSIIGVAAGLVIISNVLPRPSNVQSTRLNDPQSFGNQGKSVAITSHTYNPENGTLLLNFSLNDNSNSLTPIIDMRQIKVAVDGEKLESGQTEYYVVPTSLHTIAVQFKDVNRAFRKATVTFSDKSLSGSDISTGQQDELADSTSETKTKDTENAEFIINNDHLKEDENLQIQSQKQLALEQNTTDIKATNKYIKNQENGIKKWRKIIKEQESNIDLAKQNMTEVDSDSASALQSNIETYQAQIDDAKQKISETNGNISDAENRISKLKETRMDIQNGNLDLPKPY